MEHAIDLDVEDQLALMNEAMELRSQISQSSNNAAATPNHGVSLESRHCVWRDHLYFRCVLCQEL